MSTALWDDREMLGTPFLDYLAIANPSIANGVQVVAAVAGQTPFVLGYIFEEDAGTAQFLQLEHTSGAAGRTQIGRQEEIDGNRVRVRCGLNPPIEGAYGQNIGVLGTAATAVNIVVWGYYA